MEFLDDCEIELRNIHSRYRYAIIIITITNYIHLVCVCATHQPSGTSSTSKRLNLLCDCDTVHLSLGEDVYLFLLKNARGYFITRGVLIIIIYFIYLLPNPHRNFRYAHLTGVKHNA